MMTRTDFVGQFCAEAERASKGAASAAAVPFRAFRRDITWRTRSSPLVLLRIIENALRSGESAGCCPFLAVFHGPYSEPMAKNPDKPKKDPARVTRAKAAREPLAPIAPALEQLLNPGIAKGTAGVGSQTGLDAREKPAP